MITEQYKTIILPLYTILVPLHLECSVQFWYQSSKGMFWSLRVQRKATKLIEDLNYEEQLQRREEIQ